MQFVISLVLVLAAASVAGAGPLDHPGAMKALNCSACHGFAGQSIADTMPSLAGVWPEYFKKAIADYASGKRPSVEMEPYAKQVLQFGVDDYAAYFGSLTRKPTSVKVDSTAAGRGRVAAQPCGVCPGPEGRGDRAKLIPEPAAQLASSRTPVREALGRLQHEGLVELLPGGGVRVAVLALEDAAELYDLREVLDGLAARLAAQHASPASLARLEGSLARMAQCLARNYANQWFEAHVAFHDEIFQASGNARLIGLSAVVKLSIQRFHPVLLRTPHRLADADREHRGIHAAIAAGEGERAERLARSHIAGAKEIVVKVMGQGDRDGAVQA